MGRIAILVPILCLILSDVRADKPLKVFILAGQSNMVGWGDSLKLPDQLRDGNDRVLMFEQGKWQTLKPLAKAQKHHAKFGMTLPLLCGSPRRAEDPADLSDLVPERIAGPYPAVEFVLKAQWDAQQQIPHARTVILRDIETHPMNVHYNTAGQLEVGRLFAEAFLKSRD